MTARYRVEGYTERHDGTPVFCICDYSREAETGLSPIVSEPDLARHWLFTDKAEAERVAESLAVS